MLTVLLVIQSSTGQLHNTEITHVSLALNVIPAIHAKHIITFMAFVCWAIFYGLEANTA